MTIKNKAYIAGVFEHPTRKADDKSLAQLHAEVGRRRAGRRRADPGRRRRLFLRRRRARAWAALSMADYMGLKLRHIDTTETGGSSYVIHVGHAAEAIAPASATWRSSRWPGGRAPRAWRPARAPRNYGAAAPDVAFEYPYGPTVVNQYAMCAMRHMHQYGTTSAQLAWIKVAASHHAQHNPHALLREVVTVEEVRRLADHRRPAAPPRLLRDHRRRRRDRGGQAGDREAA